VIDTTKKPDFINPEGTEWWADNDMNDYAMRTWGLYLECWIIKTKSGYMTRLVTENGKELKESPQLEAVACFIDALAFSRGMTKK